MLHLTADRGDTEAVGQLLDKGADVDVKDRVRELIWLTS